MKKNIDPFEILLDMYATECFYLYGVLRSFKNYPSIMQERDDWDPVGKLYSTAFARICAQFLVDNAGMYPHEDFEGYYEQMEFQEDVEFYARLAREKGISPSLNFTYTLDKLVEIYINKIKSDLEEMYPRIEDRYTFFYSVFLMSPDELDFQTGSNNHSFLNIKRAVSQ